MVNFIKKQIMKMVPKIQEYEYDIIYSSRKVVKNQYLYINKQTHFYSKDIWGTVCNELKPFLFKGMTVYGECVGYLSSGKDIQPGYDYGCAPCKHENYVYRITTTNEDGKVVEWTMLQVQQWCKANGLKAVPLYYYGKALNLFETEKMFKLGLSKDDRDIQEWQHLFLECLQETYLEKKCSICKNDVPDEGICLRLESLDIDVFKLKSFLFRQMETKSLDKGESNIEDEQIEEN
jgi:hypothetical protein